MFALFCSNLTYQELSLGRKQDAQLLESHRQDTATNALLAQF
jgi:hypothetical protein